MATIERIETAGPDAKARRLVFSDTSVRVTSAAAVRVLALEPGSAFEQEDLERTLAQVEPGLAKDRALRFLGYRDRSIDEVSLRLSRDGYPAKVVASVVDRLVDLGLLDNERFALSWARTRASSGLGRSRILRELKDRGIDVELAQAAVAEALEDTSETQRALLMIGKRAPGTPKERDRMIRRLVSKGYSISVAIEAIELLDSQSEE